MRRRTFLAAPAAASLVQSLPAAAGQSGTSPVRFPPKFAWGVSTSAFQFEGALKADGRGQSVWDSAAEAHPPGAAAPAVDGYHRWRQDIALLHALGVTAYRFSVAWPRVIPQGIGQVNARGLDFYDRLVDRLLAANITPFLCLYHWDLPIALQSIGGWLNRDVVDAFTRYAMVVADRLGDRVRYWIPINEALSIAYGGYAVGYFPPYVQDQTAYFTAAHHLNLAQGAAFKALAAPGRKLGAAMCLYPIRPVTPESEDAVAAEAFAAMTTKFFLDPLLRGRYPATIERYVADSVRPDDLARIRHPVDFVGVNYYGPQYRQAQAGSAFGAWSSGGRSATANGSLIDASGLYDQLRELRTDYGNPPVFITENGAAFVESPQEDRIQDDQRIGFLRDHLLAAHRAMTEGADLRGYFVWSIMDNYEWGSGFDFRFGLVYVDLATGRRTPKSSFHWYRDIVRSGSV